MKGQKQRQCDTDKDRGTEIRRGIRTGTGTGKERHRKGKRHGQRQGRTQGQTDRDRRTATVTDRQELGTRTKWQEQRYQDRKIGKDSDREIGTRTRTKNLE